jgi:hypothetical protein
MSIIKITKLLGTNRAVSQAETLVHKKKGGEHMSVTSTPISATFRIRNSDGAIIQTFNRLNPQLGPDELRLLRVSLNNIRPESLPVGEGTYIVKEELKAA